MSSHLKATGILDYEDPSIRELIAARGWRHLSENDRIKAIYDFVRDEIGFGYNESDELSASRVLADGYGQCNTKTTLLMALLRAVGIPCRFHGAMIHKELQKGVVTGVFYRLAPTNIIHSWVEIDFNGHWVGLEGVILDDAYLEGLRNSIATEGGEFLGYGVGTEDVDNPPIQWSGSDTTIQSTGVNQDFGIYDDPDTFYAQHGVNITGAKDFIFRHLVRHLMNRRVKEIRSCAVSHRETPSSLKLDSDRA